MGTCRALFIFSAEDHKMHVIQAKVGLYPEVNYK